MDIVAPGYTEVGHEEVNDREWSEEDGAWLMLFRGLDEVDGFPLSTQIIDNVTVMIWHPEYGLIYLEARPEFELIKKNQYRFYRKMRQWSISIKLLSDIR